MPIWLMIAGAAVLAAALTLAADHVLQLRRVPAGSATPLPTPTTTPRPRVVVEIQSPEPQPSPSAFASAERDRALSQLQQDADTQLSGMLILKAERHVALAQEALLANNTSQADRELVAAKASLDDAFRLASEDLKPQITNERWMIGQVRADFEVDPRDLDEDLHRMRDRLLALVVSRGQE
jgi:hypothetical protein